MATTDVDVPRATDVPDLIPARMLNEFAYCPRLAYLEWVQGEFADNLEVLEGRFGHRRVDRGRAFPVASRTIQVGDLFQDGSAGVWPDITRAAAVEVEAQHVCSNLNRHPRVAEVGDPTNLDFHPVLAALTR